MQLGEPAGYVIGVALLLAFAGIVAFASIVWIGGAEAFRRRRKKPPWDFTDDAEKLHRLMHPEEYDEKPPK